MDLMYITYRLAEAHFIEVLCVLSVLLIVSAVTAFLSRRRPVFQMVMFCLVVFQLVFLFSFLSIKDDINRKNEETAITSEPSEVWSYIIVEK